MSEKLSPKQRLRAALPVIGEHTAVLFLFALLSIAATWPLARSFSSALPDAFDSLLDVWNQWHLREALAGREPLLSTTLLFAPVGMSLASASTGPVLGLLGLPFALWGPIATYNGAILLGSSLTGWLMYITARCLGLPRPPSFFAGLVLLFAPLRMAAIEAGHLHIVFLGLIPLLALLTSRALDPERDWKWSPAAGATLLAAAFVSGDLMVYGGLLAAALCAHALWIHRADAERGPQLRRILRLSLFMALFVVPYVGLIGRQVAASGIDIVRATESRIHQPDALQFILPGSFGRSWLNSSMAPVLQPSLVTAIGRSPTESSVFMAWTALALLSFAVVRRAPGSGRWLAVLALALVFSLGPVLQVNGISSFTVHQVPIALPFAFLNSLPGLDVLRTPGRAMIVGYTALAILAGMGLKLAQAGWRRVGSVLPIVCAALLVVECWNTPMTPWKPPVVPAFYAEIAKDPDRYAVFDLPIRPEREIGYASSYITYAARYQWFQLVHRKAIATGHVSRYPNIHPVFSEFVAESTNSTGYESDIRVNGAPASRYANARLELARNGYRYVVVHKPDGLSGYDRGGWADLGVQTFVRTVFGNETPVRDDEQVTVYAVGSPPEVYAPSLVMQETFFSGWVNGNSAQRQAIVPTSFYLASPTKGLARLEILVVGAYDRKLGGGANPRTLMVKTAAGPPIVMPLQFGTRVAVEFPVAAGAQTITLTSSLVDPDTGVEQIDRANLLLGAIDLTLTPSP
ncbi:MAG TPA: hypothetical protein PKY66_00680 [Thermoflexales bacterium]|nr:hypothetical protein [Thermoflexales bacterium]